MTDAGTFAGAALGAAAGLLAAYLYIRREFDRPMSLATVAALLGATPLLHAIVHGSLSDTAIFAAMAAIALATSVWVKPVAAQATALVLATLLVPLIAPTSAVAPTLFSPANGFLALTPVVYLAVIGTAARARTHTGEAASAMLALVLWPLTDTSLVPMLALLAPGLASAAAFARRRPLVAAAPLVLFAILWNYWLMVQYTAGTIPKDAPVSFAAMVRQQADVHTRQPYVYPFAFPANLIAAARHGVPVSRYDALSAVRAAATFDLRLDRNADLFLLDGWGAIGSNAAGAFRTLAAPRATVIVPLDPAPRTYGLSARMAARGDAPDSATDVQFEVNGHALPAVRLRGQVVSDARVEIAGPEVGRILRAGYNRLSIVSPTSARVAVYHLRLAPVE